MTYTLNNAEDQKDLSYDVTVKGDFASISQFIVQVENLPYEAQIESATIAKTADSKDKKSTWSANMTIGITNLNTTANQ